MLICRLWLTHHQRERNAVRTTPETRNGIQVHLMKTLRRHCIGRLTVRFLENGVVHWRPSEATLTLLRRTKPTHTRTIEQEETYNYRLVDGSEITLHRDPFREEPYSQGRHAEMVAKYSGIIDPYTIERTPEPLPHPYIRKPWARRSLRDSLSANGSDFQFPVLMAGVYPTLDLKQWGDTDCVIGVEKDEYGHERDTLVVERRPVIWRKLLSTYTLPSVQLQRERELCLCWFPVFIRDVPKGKLCKLRAVRSWHNEKLTKEQQVTMLVRLQDEMLAAIRLRLKEEKSLKADRYWIHYRILAEATEGIWQAIVRDSRTFAGGKRLLPFRYVNGVDGFHNSVLGYTRSVCKRWPDLIDAQQDEWNFRKELGKEGFAVEEMSPHEVLYEMRRRIIEANPEHADAEVKRKSTRQAPKKTLIRHLRNENHASYKTNCSRWCDYELLHMKKHFGKGGKGIEVLLWRMQREKVLWFYKGRTMSDAGEITI